MQIKKKFYTVGTVVRPTRFISNEGYEDEDATNAYCYPTLEEAQEEIKNMDVPSDYTIYLVECTFTDDPVVTTSVADSTE